ncbi:MAG: hypothetical protein Q7J68_06345 [Thermoplasmata archaeon]|nr:hypothetical protein [Thermoplasmata archaeon]
MNEVRKRRSLARASRIERPGRIGEASHPWAYTQGFMGLMQLVWSHDIEFFEFDDITPASQPGHVGLAGCWISEPGALFFIWLNVNPRKKCIWLLPENMPAMLNFFVRSHLSPFFFIKTLIFLFFGYF